MNSASQKRVGDSRSPPSGRTRTVLFRSVHGPLRGQAGPQQFYFSGYALGCGAAIIGRGVTRKIKQGIAVAINRPTVVALESGPLRQLDPMRDAARSNEFADGAGRLVEFFFVGIELQSGIDAIERAISHFNFFVEASALLRFARQCTRRTSGPGQ